MKISVKAKKEDGTVIFDGELTGPELSFLVQYAINDLVNAGVHFLTETDEEESEQASFQFDAPPTQQ